MQLRKPIVATLLPLPEGLTIWRWCVRAELHWRDVDRDRDLVRHAGKIAGGAPQHPNATPAPGEDKVRQTIRSLWDAPRFGDVLAYLRALVEARRRADARAAGRPAPRPPRARTRAAGGR